MDTETLRLYFPALREQMEDQPLIYLDNAATTQKPVQVLEEVRLALTRYSGNPGRGLYRLSHQAQQKIETARKTIANFIGAKPQETIFTYNTTDSINQIARMTCSQDLTGKNIAVTLSEHHANYLPWKEAAQRTGAEFREIQIDSEGMIDTSDLDRKIDENTHIFAFSHICNVTGNIHPVKELVQASENATYTVMDAAQSAPHVPLDLHHIGVDFAAFSAHKMLAPPGLGVLYGKQKLLETLKPTRFGGGMVLDGAAQEYKKTPERHEAGTVNLPSIVGLWRAVEFLQDIGVENVLEHSRRLAVKLRRALEDISGVKTLVESPDSGIVSFHVENIHSHDIASFLNQHGIAVRAGRHCSHPMLDFLGIDDTVRVSCYLYNTEEEIEKTIEVIQQAVNKLGGNNV